MIYPCLYDRDILRNRRISDKVKHKPNPGKQIDSGNKKNAAEPA